MTRRRPLSSLLLLLVLTLALQVLLSSSMVLPNPGHTESRINQQRTLDIIKRKHMGSKFMCLISPRNCPGRYRRRSYLGKEVDDASSNDLSHEAWDDWKNLFLLRLRLSAEASEPNHAMNH